MSDIREDNVENGFNRLKEDLKQANSKVGRYYPTLQWSV